MGRLYFRLGAVLQVFCNSPRVKLKARHDSGLPFETFFVHRSSGRLHLRPWLDKLSNAGGRKNNQSGTEIARETAAHHDCESCN